MISKLSCDIGCLSSLQELDISHNGMFYQHLAACFSAYCIISETGRRVC